MRVIEKLLVTVVSISLCGCALLARTHYLSPTSEGGRGERSWLPTGFQNVRGPADRLVINRPDFRISIWDEGEQSRIVAFGPLLPFAIVPTLFNWPLPWKRSHVTEITIALEKTRADANVAWSPFKVELLAANGRRIPPIRVVSGHPQKVASANDILDIADGERLDTTLTFDEKMPNVESLVLEVRGVSVNGVAADSLTVSLTPSKGWATAGVP